jgi:uncharacterized SAM-binding protein YcdF (DUF218 family)
VPSNLLVLVSTLGVVIGNLCPRHRGLAILPITVLLASAFLPIGSFLLHPLEERFSRPQELPTRVDGIIVLGGSVRPGIASDRDEASTNEHGERLAAGLLLAQLYPSAPLVYTGGSASLVPGRPPETKIAARWYAEAGLHSERLHLERRSRTTWENALYTKELLSPGPDQSWILVTSAFHMPRAIAAFDALDWQVVPWPVDYQTSRKISVANWPVVSQNLSYLDLAVHEWIGLLYYRLSQRSRRFLPAPK